MIVTGIPSRFRARRHTPKWRDRQISTEVPRIAQTDDMFDATTLGLGTKVKAAHR
jgi:hypothetical protein